MRATLRALAIILAVVAAGGEGLRSWGADRPWFTVADDFFMAALLIAAAVRAIRPEGPALLCGAFGFASGMLYGSFFGHVQALSGRSTPRQHPARRLAPVLAMTGVGGHAHGLRT